MIFGLVGFRISDYQAQIEDKHDGGTEEQRSREIALGVLHLSGDVGGGVPPSEAEHDENERCRHTGRVVEMAKFIQGSIDHLSNFFRRDLSPLRPHFEM